MATNVNPLDRINQLVEKVKKLREERDQKVKVLDEGVEAAENDLKDAVAAMRGALDEAVAPVKKKRAPGNGMKRGELMAKVAEMLARGMTEEAMAKELGSTVDNVRQAVKRVRLKMIHERAPGGPAAAPIVAPSVLSRATGDRAVVAAPPPAPARTNGLDDDDDSSATVDDLRRVVLRNGTKARLLTTIRNGHKHIADVNRDGNGYTTTSGKDGHVHAVKAFVMGAGPDGHRHDLTTEAA